MKYIVIGAGYVSARHARFSLMGQNLFVEDLGSTNGTLVNDVDIDECLLREVREETGVTLTSWKFRGVVTFLTDGGWEGEYMYLFTANGFEGELKECDEGDLQWVSREFLDQLPKWEGDKIFLDLLWQDAPFFLLKLRYEGDKLVEAVLDGKKIK